MAYCYLASPYTHSDPFMREARYLSAAQATAHLLAQHIWVYSPIVHCHELSKIARLPEHFEFWQNYNFGMLAEAHHLRILQLDGWKESKGVQAEIEYARKLDKQIIYMPVLKRSPDAHYTL